MRRFAACSLCAAMVIGATPSFAQSVPEGQSCGGLLCDMGVFGHKTAPKPQNEAAVAPEPVAPRRIEAAPPLAEAPPEVEKPQPKKSVVHRKKRPATVVNAVPASKPAAVALKAAGSASGGVRTPTKNATAVSTPAAPPPAPAFQFKPLYNF